MKFQGFDLKPNRNGDIHMFRFSPKSKGEVTEIFTFLDLSPKNKGKIKVKKISSLKVKEIFH